MVENMELRIGLNMTYSETWRHRHRSNVREALVMSMSVFHQYKQTHRIPEHGTYIAIAPEF
jgi:hypothetical protein